MRKLLLTTVLLLGLLGGLLFSATAASANPCEGATFINASVQVETGIGNATQDNDQAIICQQANATAVNTGAGGTANASASNSATINQ